MSPASRPPRPDVLPRWAAGLLRSVLPLAERDEVLGDVGAEYGHRRRTGGRATAARWLWRQIAASLPVLARRSVWRGMTGFEPRASRLRPGGPPMEGWIIDLRYSLRRLRTRPLYAAIAVLTLALGVGGAAAIAGVVRGLLVKPLPYADERALAVFWSPTDWSEQEFLHLRPDFPGFAAVAAYRHDAVTFEPKDGPARLLPALRATAELFQVLGRDAYLGRALRPGDDQQGAERVAVLSHGLWQELGADPSLVGRTIRLDGGERIVAGVMPPGFWFPDPEVRIWIAETLDPDDGSGNYVLLGRRAPGVPEEGLRPHLARIAARLDERYDYPSQWDKTRSPHVTPLREALVGGVRAPLLATLAAMGMILLIACANVSALMLGQVEGRSTELAVRVALGAERARLLRQLLAESLVVGAGAGLAGAAVAAGGFRVLVGSLPLGVWAQGASLDWTVFAAALATALAASLLVALVPVISLCRGELQGVLAATRTAGVAGRGGRLESALVVAEVALAVLMAAGAALLVRSVANLRAIDPGLDAANVAVLDVVLPGNLEREPRRGLLRDLTAELAALPGVRAAAVTHKLPLRGSGSSNSISVEGRPDLPVTTTYFRIVSPGYFEALGIPLRRGRTFRESDRGTAPAAEGDETPVVINEALAARYFPGEDPVGRFVGGLGLRERIVGVVGNAAEGDLIDPPAPARYWLVDHVPFLIGEQTFVLRVAPGLDPASVLGAARSAVQRRAPSVAIQNATTMGSVLAEAMGPARRVVLLLGLLTALAVLLGAIGVYGVISHFVGRRRRDWAIRIALGLSPGRVLGAVLRRGSVLLLAGIAIGAALTVALARFLSSLLYGVGASDPAALAAAGLALLLVGLLAALVPAWRASRTPPGLLLREV